MRGQRLRASLRQWPSRGVEEQRAEVHKRGSDSCCGWGGGGGGGDLAAVQRLVHCLFFVQEGGPGPEGRVVGVHLQVRNSHRMPRQQQEDVEGLHLTLSWKLWLRRLRDWRERERMVGSTSTGRRLSCSRGCRR